MKQKDILLWTITIAALLLSVLSVVQSRLSINPLSSDASMMGISGSTLVGGGMVSTMQGSESCKTWRDKVLNNLGEGIPDLNNDEEFLLFPAKCANNSFCRKVDRSIAGIENEQDRADMDAWYNYYCDNDGAGGTQPPIGQYSRTFTGSGGDTCTSTNPEVHTYFECIEDNNQ